ncbi:MAG: dihydropyrimidinase [bacterium]
MHAVINSDRVVTPDGVIPAFVRVEDGVIRSVTPELDPPPGQYAVLDATGLVLMPGGVDLHTHLELEVGGVRTAGDWASASLAALWGGTTTVVDFAEPGPDGSLLTGLALQQERAAGAVVDFGFHMTVTDASPPRLHELEEVVSRGQASLKVYTAYPGRLMLEPDALEQVFRRAAALGARVMVHCEDGHAIRENIRQAVARGETGAIQHARTRPPETEERAVRQVLELAAKTGAAVHLAHLSTAGAVAALREARASGLPVTAETCPQYLWLEESRLSWPAPAGLCHVCSPPLRTAPHLDALWDGLADGSIDAVSTDHCPFHWHGGKDRGLTPNGEDFTRTPGGLPGVETRLPLVFAGGVEAQRFGLGRFVELVSSGPARLAGLYPRKGVIAPGADADLVLFDPENGTDLNAEVLHMQVDHSPYEGLWAQGRVVAVMRRGVLVIADGEVINPPPPGRLLRRAPVRPTDESRSRP